MFNQSPNFKDDSQESRELQSSSFAKHNNRENDLVDILRSKLKSATTSLIRFKPEQSSSKTKFLENLQCGDVLVQQYWHGGYLYNSYGLIVGINKDLDKLESLQILQKSPITQDLIVVSKNLKELIKIPLAEAMAFKREHTDSITYETLSPSVLYNAEILLRLGPLGLEFSRLAVQHQATIPLVVDPVSGKILKVNESLDLKAREASVILKTTNIFISLKDYIEKAEIAPKCSYAAHYSINLAIEIANRLTLAERLKLSEAVM